MPLLGKRFEIFERSSPFDEVPTLGGFKTHPQGHIDVWEEFRRERQDLLRFPYEYFPRGRVNWREDDDTYLFLADALVFEQQLHQILLEDWHLRSEQVLFLRDPHYNSPRFTRAWRGI